VARQKKRTLPVQNMTFRQNPPAKPSPGHEFRLIVFRHPGGQLTKHVVEVPIGTSVAQERRIAQEIANQQRWAQEAGQPLPSVGRPPRATEGPQAA